MLIEIAIGDAYGAGFEYATENLVHNDVSKYIGHPTHKIGYGRYTDDTQMTIAVAEHMVQNYNDLFSITKIISKFIDCFKRDPRVGYSKNFQRILEDIAKIDDSSAACLAFSNIVEGKSDKSGAAMRSCPIGLIHDLEKVLKFASLQAKITHDTSIGVTSSQIVAASVWHLDAGGECGQLKYFLKNECLLNLEDFTFNWIGKVKSKGNMSVSAALTCLINNADEGSISKLLQECVNFGGDTDTVASIALGMASVSNEYYNDLNEALIYGLEDGKYGSSYLNRLEEQLRQKINYDE